MLSTPAASVVAAIAVRARAIGQRVGDDLAHAMSTFTFAALVVVLWITFVCLQKTPQQQKQDLAERVRETSITALDAISSLRASIYALVLLACALVNLPFCIFGLDAATNVIYSVILGLVLCAADAPDDDMESTLSRGQM